MEYLFYRNFCYISRRGGLVWGMWCIILGKIVFIYHTFVLHINLALYKNPWISLYLFISLIGLD